MQSFRDVLDLCGFVDLGYSGPEFTWHGRRKGELIWEQLDRSVANYEWLARFPTGRIKHLHCFTSNHRPILLSLDSNGENQLWKRKPFRFLRQCGCPTQSARGLFQLRGQVILKVHRWQWQLRKLRNEKRC